MSDLAKTTDCRIRLSAIRGMARWFRRRAVARRGKPLHEAADRSEVVCNKTQIKAITPTILPEHIARIRGGPLTLTAEDIREKLHRKHFDLTSVIAHRFYGAHIVGGTMYHKNLWLTFRKHGDRTPGVLPVGPAVELERAAIATTQMGGRWFGHWLHDDLPYQLLAKNYGHPVTHVHSPYRHEPGIRDALSLSQPTQVGVGHFDELTLCVDHAMSTDKTRRFLALRERIRCPDSCNKRVFLRRGSGGDPRSIVNQDELFRWFEQEGIAIVETENRSFSEILGDCMGAELIIGVEGSHMAMGFLFGKRDGWFVLLNPPSRADTIINDIGLFFGLRSAVFVGSAADSQAGGFHVDITELSNLLTLVGRASDREQGRIDCFLESASSRDY